MRFYFTPRYAMRFSQRFIFKRK